MTPVVAPGDRARVEAVVKACPRRLSGHGLPSLEQAALDLADEAARGGDRDIYGAGGVVTEVEEQVRDLLQAEAAVMLPSGTMAQQVALRLHCEQRGLDTVAMHPTSHPVLWEDDALTALAGLTVVQGPEVPQDLSGLAAVLLEVPRRETGGHLPTWDELVDVSFRCAEAGVALHLDGARLWQCGPFYAPRTLAQVAGLFDTVYVSLYKDLAGTAGAVLLCPEDLADDVRTWRHRYGGTLPALWPLALGARRGLREHLPRMPLYVDAAKALAATGLETAAPVETPLLHVVLPCPDLQRLADALVDVAEESGVWLSNGVRQGPREGTASVEVSCGEATLQLDPAEVAGLLRRASDLAG